MRLIHRDWERPLPTQRQQRADVLLAVAAALVSVASVEIFRSANGADLGWRGIEAYGWFALTGLLLAGRRRLPLTTMVLEAVVFIVIGERLEAFAGVFTIQMIMFAAMYSAWAWSRRPRLLLGTTAVVVVAMFAWLVILFGRPDTMPETESVGLLSSSLAIMVYSYVINVVYFGGAIAWGQAAWMSARRRALIEEQVARERSQQDAERGRAVQAERVRIARDLHDVVAHHVSGIGVQASGAARLLDRKPDAARQALSRIETSSRQAVTQMHQLVGLLREQGDDRESARGPQPGLDDIAELARQSQDPAVELHLVGEPRPVSSTVGLSLFRITQEALTNVRRHARAKQATVTVRHLDGDRPAVEVEVLDDGSGRPATADDGGGFGLEGIRERVATHGGEAEIGPRPQGGFRVRVRIPVDDETDIP